MSQHALLVGEVGEQERSGRPFAQPHCENVDAVKSHHMAPPQPPTRLALPLLLLLAPLASSQPLPPPPQPLPDGTCLVASTFAGTPRPPQQSAWGVAVDSAGTVFMTEMVEHTIVRISSASGFVVTPWVGQRDVAGFQDGVGSRALLNLPMALVFGPGGDLFATDTWNAAVRRITPGGNVSTFCGGNGFGSVDGACRKAQFGSMTIGLAYDAARGILYVGDNMDDGSNGIVRAIQNGETRSIRQQLGGPAGSIITVLAVRRDGSVLYASDSALECIYAFDPSQPDGGSNASGWPIVAGSPSGAAGYADGTGSSVLFDYPYGLVLSVDGSILYVMDTYNNRIRRVAVASGVVTTFAGNGDTAQFSGGTGTSASFGGSAAVALSSANVLYSFDCHAAAPFVLFLF